MSNKNDKYRNPPAPLGYVCKKQPKIACKKGNIDGDFQNFMDCIIDSGILDVADITLYDCFTINAGSEDEEIIEVPVEPSLKVVEVIDIDSDIVPHSSSTEKNVEIPVEPCYKMVEVKGIDPDVVPELSAKKDMSVTFKMETDLDKTVSSSETSKNLKKDTNVISLHKKAVPQRDTSEKVTSEKIKSCRKQSSLDKKIREGTAISDTTRKEMNSDKLDAASAMSKDLEKGSETSSDGHKNIALNEETSNINEKVKNKKHVHDKESNKKTRKKTVSYNNCSDSDSYCKNKHKRKNGSVSSKNSHTKSSKHKKTNDYMSDNDSSSRNKRKKEDGYSIYRNSYSCKIKPNGERMALVSYSSDDSDCSSRMTGREHRDVSPGFKEYHPYEYERNVANIKQEDQYGGLFGEYFCYTCKISMNSLATYQSHMTGKRHEKALKAQNVVGIVARTVVHTEQTSKYPKPYPGYYRVKLDCLAKIQSFLNEKLRTPCPGLDNVIEIQGFSDTLYYCSLCDSQCSANSIFPHLTGFKHQLNCLKHFRNDLYQKWSYKSKYQIEKQVAIELKAVEKEQGRGLIKVEKDFPETWEPTAEDEMASFKDANTPSTSLQASGTDLSDSLDIPDPSKSGFYCKVCESHCNSWGMWENHVAGKRHLRNVKKIPGSAPSKSKYIAAPNDKAFLLKDLETVIEPVVGLDQIREIRKPEINGITYNCFLCSSCVPSIDIVNHILSRKHREKYLDSIKHPELETVRNCQMSEAATNSIIQEICARAEADNGSGKPEVYYAKSAVYKG